MENATKALIIAGAVLISILLISIGIALINSNKDVSGTANKLSTDMNDKSSATKDKITTTLSDVNFLK